MIRQTQYFGDIQLLRQRASEATARPPTLMNIRSAVSLSEPTLTYFEDSKRACPWYTVQFVIPLSRSLR